MGRKGNEKRKTENVSPKYKAPFTSVILKEQKTRRRFYFYVVYMK